MVPRQLLGQSLMFFVENNAGATILMFGRKAGSELATHLHCLLSVSVY